MVATPSKLAALAALLLAAVDATSIENNPVTILEAVVPMTDVHPAYGGPVREIKPVVVPDNTDEERAAGKVITNTSAVEIRSAAYRKLEGAPTDMAKLEKYFGTKLEVNYKKLLSSCKKGTPHQIPWPSSYWPVYMDSINARWTNEASPAEKYAKAFGKDVTKFMDTVSQVNGIDGFSSYKKCTSNPDCASDGSTCAKRAGKSSGYCIPTWYGICHAWAPASNWEPEPQCDVVKNGVTFHPYDLKGLVSAIYDGAQINTVFTGTRFYGPDSPDTKDKYGRYTDAQRRDLGAGFFHIAIANIMCLQGHSFVVDVTAGAEVWNQPVSGYEVIESTIMDPAKAGKEHFGTNNYPFNDAAKYVAYTKTRFSYIIEAYEDGPLVPNKLGPYTTTVDYEYFVELDASYNVIGGEWLGDTRYNHPDFLWFATGTPSLDTVTKIGLSYKEVRAMIDESVACKGSSTPAPTTPAPTTPAPTTVKPTTTPAPTTPAPTTPTPTTVKPTTTPAATTVKPTTTPAATTATPTSTPVATTVKPTSTPAVTTDKPSVTTPAPTDKPSVTTPAPTTDKPAATTPAPTTASPSTGATPVPTTVAPPAGKPTPPGGKPTPAPEPSTDAPPAGKPTPPGGKPTPPAGKPTPAPEPSTASPSTGATPVPTTVAPPAGKPTPPGGKPTPAPEPSTDAPPAGKPTPPGGKPTPPAGKPTPAPEPSTASPSTGATPVPTTVAPPAGKPTPPGGKPTPAPEPSTDAPPAGKPTPPAETPASGGVPPPGKVTPPGDDDSSEDDDVPVPPSSGSGKPTPVPETPAVTPAVTTAAPPAGKPTPAPSATTVAPPSDDGKGTVSPPGGDDDENDDTPVTPGSGSGKLTPPAPVPAPVPAPDSGSGKPTPPVPVPAPVPAPATSGSGSSKPTPPAPVPAPVPAPDTGAGKPTPPAPVPAPVPAPGSGAGKPTPPSTGSDREASSGSDAPTPAPTKKNKKHKLCH